MVTIRKKTINKKQYYYLEHSYKIKGKVKKKEIYLGKSLPKNIEDIKKDFLNKIYKEKYYQDLDIIKKNYVSEFKALPKLAKTKYLENFMIQFTYDSNRIEGSTITLKETARLLEDGIAPRNRPIKDIKETEAHKKVFYEMLRSKDLNLKEILHWHRMLFKETEPEIAGIIRKHGVQVAGSKAEFPFPAELDTLLREFIRWYNKNKDPLHPVKLAALAHLKFVSIHPFTDGNGRISRMIMNFILKRNNFPMLNIHYSNRDTYYTALERSQVKRIEVIFVQHIIKRYLKAYRKYC
jgi:Fic family protein